MASTRRCMTWVCSTQPLSDARRKPLPAFPIDPRLMIWNIDEHVGWFRPILPGFELILVDPGRRVTRTDWGTGRKTWSARWVMSLVASSGERLSREDVVGALRTLLGVRQPPIRTGGALLVQNGV